MNMSLCRLCNENEANVNIFNQAVEVQICTKINICCRILNVQENDGLPSLICNRCERELNACYQFVLRCEATDKKIRSLLISGDSEQRDPCYPTIEIKTELRPLDDDFYDSDDAVTNSTLDFIQFEDVKSKDKQDQDTLALNVKKKRPYKKRVKLKKKDLICSECGRKCLSSSILTTHMRTHTNERPYQCLSCDKAYKDSGTLKRHIDRNHLQKRERKFICETCGKAFYSKYEIKIHMRVHTRDKPYACPICPARFTQVSTLGRHKKRHTDNKAYMCATCGKAFWTKGELKKHFRKHEDVRNFSCPICPAKFKHKGSIQKHLPIHKEPHRFACNLCDQTFNNKGNLKGHIDRKHSEKSGYCDACSKNVSNIEVHMWRHTGQRPLECKFCSSSFYETKALALHINFKHKKTDKFKCIVEGCSQSFPSKPMLKFHVAKFHDHQTPYTCERCSRGFYRKNDLARHMLGTHKERLQ